MMMQGNVIVIRDVWTSAVYTHCLPWAAFRMRIHGSFCPEKLLVEIHVR